MTPSDPTSDPRLPPVAPAPPLTPSLSLWPPAVVLDANSARPGFCPRRQLTRSCLLVKSAPKECFSDVDCGAGQKCCALDCGLQCADAGELKITLLYIGELPNQQHSPM